VSDAGACPADHLVIARHRHENAVVLLIVAQRLVAAVRRRLPEIARQAHLACMEGGAEQVVTVIKIGDRRLGTTIAEKVDKFRGQA